ncbi:recombinase family protein [Ruania rhizosphaerae]|uniref:recombinase family protein n=1 Tax=Ruania rhizosphaerae TaxID=1840413 RepID=UPI00135A1573|nr:recombinase family protein [Ruania rhizosphaerae]
MPPNQKRHLQPAPERPLRAVLYLRQSTHREESISLEVQEASGRDHAERHGYQVVAVEADPGITGRTWKRPAVQRVMNMIEAGDADVVILWKWSRLSRSRRDWAVAVDLVEQAGGRIESATEPIDVATSSGRFARGVMAELAAFESERIGDTWKEAHARRVAQGRPANGKPRWGYAYDPEEKLHKPDPETGPVLASLYRRYIAGESVYGLVRWLNSNGYETLPGYSASGAGPWSDRSLRRVLDSGFGAGLINVRGEQRPGAHEAVISMGEWDAYQVARRERRVERTTERSQYLLSGMVRCQCGSSMNGGQFGGAREPKYRCKQAHAQDRHPGGYASMRVVEGAVLAWLRDLAADVEAAGEASSLQQRSARRQESLATRLTREVERVNAQLLRATRGHIAGTIPESMYAQIRDELTQQLEGLQARQQAAAVASRRAPAPELARDLLADWEVLSVELRRGALRQLIDRVVVTPARPRSTVRVVPVWEGEDR